MDQENQKKYKPVNRSQIVQHQLERRTAAAMKLNQAFALEHRGDSERELLDYLRKCAEELGRTPFPEDVVGSPFIAKQFEGGWAQALEKAGLPPLPGKPVVEVKGDRASEFARQLQLHRRKKAEKRARYEARQLKCRQREPAAPKDGADKTEKQAAAGAPADLNN